MTDPPEGSLSKTIKSRKLSIRKRINVITSVRRGRLVKDQCYLVFSRYEVSLHCGGFSVLLPGGIRRDKNARILEDAHAIRGASKVAKGEKYRAKGIERFRVFFLFS